MSYPPTPLKILSTTILNLAPEQPLLAKQLKALLETVHDDSPILIKVGDSYVHVREWRQCSFGPGEPVAKVLVPVDFQTITK